MEGSLPPAPDSSANSTANAPRVVKSSVQPTTVNVDADVLNKILTRLDKLENSSTLPSRVENRVSTLESTIDQLSRKLDKIDIENEQFQRQLGAIANQCTRYGGSIEVMQQELDARRTVVNRMDNWSRHGDAWREDMENQFTAFNRQLKEFDRKVKEHKEATLEGASKDDLEDLRTKVMAQTQHTVSANMSAWYDNIEGKVRDVQRQVAAVRIGRTIDSKESSGKDNNGKKTVKDDTGGFDLTDKEIQEALITPQPSELLVKTMVQNCISTMEKDVQLSIESRIRADLKSEHLDTTKSLKIDIQNTLSRMAAEAGIISPDNVSADTATEFSSSSSGGNTAMSQASLARQAVALRKEHERKLDNLDKKYEDISSIVIALQEGHDLNEKSKNAELRSMERKIDEVVTISENSVSTIQSRCAGLEERLRNSELSLHSASQSGKEDIFERIREATSEWTSSYNGFDKRVSLLERVCEDMVDKLKLSNSAIEAFFTSSAEGRRLQAAAAKIDIVQEQTKSYREDLHEELESIKKDKEITNKEFRDRINRIELVDTKIGSLERELTRRDTRFGTLEERLNQLDVHADMVNRNVKKLEEYQDEQGGVGRHVNDEVKDLKMMIENDKTGLDALGKRVVQSLQQVMDIRDECNTFTSQIKKLDRKIGDNTDSMKTDTTKTKEKVASMEIRVEELEQELKSIVTTGTVAFHNSGPPKSTAMSSSSTVSETKKPSTSVDNEGTLASNNKSSSSTYTPASTTTSDTIKSVSKSSTSGSSVEVSTNKPKIKSASRDSKDIEAEKPSKSSSSSHTSHSRDRDADVSATKSKNSASKSKGRDDFDSDESEPFNLIEENKPVKEKKEKKDKKDKKEKKEKESSSSTSTSHSASKSKADDKQVEKGDSFDEFDFGANSSSASKSKGSKEKESSSSTSTSHSASKSKADDKQVEKGDSFDEFDFGANSSSASKSNKGTKSSGSTKDKQENVKDVVKDYPIPATSISKAKDVDDDDEFDFSPSVANTPVTGTTTTTSVTTKTPESSTVKTTTNVMSPDTPTSLYSAKDVHEVDTPNTTNTSKSESSPFPDLDKSTFSTNKKEDSDDDFSPSVAAAVVSDTTTTTSNITSITSTADSTTAATTTVRATSAPSKPTKPVKPLSGNSSNSSLSSLGSKSKATEETEKEKQNTTSGLKVDTSESATKTSTSKEESKAPGSTSKSKQDMKERLKARMKNKEKK